MKILQEISTSTTSVPATSAREMDGPTEVLMSPSPSYSTTVKNCTDAPVCEEVSILPTVKQRKKECNGMDNEGKHICPTACGKLECYKFTQKCEDRYGEKQFVVLNVTQQCSWIKLLREVKKEPSEIGRAHV